MTPTERLLTILQLLEPPGHVKDSIEIRRRMREVYDGESGRRKFRRDLKALWSRGLIRSDLTTFDTPNRTGIERVKIPGKTTDLHLTAEEHAAIIAARRRLRSGPSSVSPTGFAGSRHYDDFDLVLRMLRFVEENDDEIALAELAAQFDCKPEQTWNLLDPLTEEGLPGQTFVGSLDWRFAEGGDDASLPVSVGLLRDRSGEPGGSPTAGRGLDELGFFPCSLAETDDRLALIADALADDRPLPDGDRAALASAESKLARWRSILMAPEPMS